MAKDNMGSILLVFSAILTVILIGYAGRIIKNDMVSELFKQPVARIIILTVILMLYYNGMVGQSLLLLIIYCLEVSKSGLEAFGPFSKEYEITNTQTLVEPTNEIYPGCLTITAQDLLNEFGGDKTALQTTVLSGYSQLLKSIPKESSSRETLDIMAKAVGLPYSVELSDDTAPLIATLLIVQGFKLSDSCQAPNKDIQNAGMQLLDGSVVSPIDQGDYYKL